MLFRSNTVENRKNTCLRFLEFNSVDSTSIDVSVKRCPSYRRKRASPWVFHRTFSSESKSRIQNLIIEILSTHSFLCYIYFSTYTINVLHHCKTVLATSRKMVDKIRQTRPNRQTISAYSAQLDGQTNRYKLQL